MKLMSGLFTLLLLSNTYAVTCFTNKLDLDIKFGDGPRGTDTTTIILHNGTKTTFHSLYEITKTNGGCYSHTTYELVLPNFKINLHSSYGLAHTRCSEGLSMNGTIEINQEVQSLICEI